MTNPQNVEDTILALAEQATAGPFRVEEVGVGELFIVRPDSNDADGGWWPLIEMSNDNAYADAAYIAALGTYGKAMADVVRAARAADSFIERGYSSDHVLVRANLADVHSALAALDKEEKRG